MTANQSQNRGSIVIGVALVGLGALFLLGQVFDLNLGRYLWPFFIIIPGALFFVGMLLGGKAAGPLAIPASIVTMTGLLLLYQSTFNHFESWWYAWSLIFPTSVGIGLVINGGWSDNDRLVRVGMRWATTGIAIFMVLGIFFELILNVSRGFAGNVVWPLVLIGFGAYLLMRRSRSSASSEGAPKMVEAPPAPPAPPEAPPAPKAPEFEPIDMNRGKDQ